MVSWMSKTCVQQKPTSHRYFLYPAHETYSRLRQREIPCSDHRSSFQLSPTLSVCTPCVSFSKLTFGNPIAKKLSTRSFHFAPQCFFVPFRNIEILGGIRLPNKWGHTERNMVLSFNPHESSKVNPEASRKLNTPHPPISS